FMSELRDRVSRLLKRLEVMASHRAAAIVIQDSLRADSLIAENGLHQPVVYYVPNGAAGPPVTTKSRYFHQLLGLRETDRVILHLGGIDPGFRTLELANAASEWPKGWTLVLHERARRETSDPYIQSVLAAGQGRVALSLQPVQYDQVHVLVSAADIGVVL